MAEDQGVMAAMKLTVAFDDGKRVEVDVKPRDIARLEEFDRDITREGENVAITPRRAYILAWVALNRMNRTGALGIDLPASLDEFLDVADIEAEEDDSANPSPPAPTTG